MAGIWEHWQDAEGNEIQTCAVITTEAKQAISEIHHRMPDHIDRGDYAKWLDCSSENTDDASALLDNTSPNYQYYAVSTQVNNSRNEGRDLIRGIELDS